MKNRRSMGTLPEKWGFIPSLTDCVGKTIAQVEYVKMPWGCTWSSAWAIKFTDGSRAFFVGSEGSGIVNPEFDEVKKCPIFTPEEIGEYATKIAHEKRRREEDERRRKQNELDRLKRELGETQEPRNG